VTVGQHVAVGQRIGAMGSTGRSTGTHLHYEVWVNGRPQNPLRFVKAGDYVQQNQF
jgi:murein DD-endopeptidase MepM/ murein hydrolase activator NlpD